MMTLISLAIVVAFVTSWAGTLGLFEVEIWWELATLITIMLLGHWLEMRSIAQARGALAALAELLPDTAERVTDGGTETVRSRRCAVGDVVLVRPGAPRARPTATVVDGERRRRRVDDHRRVEAGRQGARRHGRRRHRRGRRQPPGPGHGRRRGDGAVGDHAAGRGGPGLGVAGPGARRPRRGDPVLRRPRRPASITLVVLVAAGRSARARSSGPRPSSSSPARTRSAWRSRSSSRSRRRSAPATACSSRTGSRSSGRASSTVVIFDKTGHAHEGRAGRSRPSRPPAATRPRCSALAAAVEADSEHPLARAIVAGARTPRDRGPGRQPASRRWPVAAPGRSVDGRAVAVGGPRLLAELGARRRSPRHGRVGRRGPDGPPRRRRRPRSSARSRSRTRSGPSRARRSRASTPSGSGSR